MFVHSMWMDLWKTLSLCVAFQTFKNHPFASTLRSTAFLPPKNPYTAKTKPSRRRARALFCAKIYSS